MLEAAFDFCIGCIVFYFLIMLNLIPKETKEKCSILFKVSTERDDASSSDTIMTNSPVDTTTISMTPRIVYS